MIGKLLLGMALGVVVANGADAQIRYKPGSNFGTDGLATPPRPAGEGDLYAVGQQSDGKVLAGGILWQPNGGPIDSAHILRLKANGTLDSTFGIHGIGGAQMGFFVQGIREIKVLSGDRFLALGKTVNGTHAIGGIMRYNADGSKDATFNNGAAAVLSVAGANIYPTTMELQSDGKIIVGAQKYTSPSAQDSFYIYRLTANGALDPTFASDGIYRLKSSFEAADGGDRKFRVKIDGQDRIYLPVVQTSAQPAPMSVLRLTANGAPDATFGTNGMSATATALNTNASFSLALLPSGRIVGFGAASGAPPTLTIASFRLTAGGQLDAAYGTSGIADVVTGPFPNGNTDVYGTANGEHLLMAFTSVGDQTSILNTVLMDIDTTGSPGVLFDGQDTLTTRLATIPAGQIWYVKIMGIGRSTDNHLYLCGTAGPTFGFVMKFVQTPTGIAMLNNRLELQAYPNPAGERLTLHCAGGVAYALYDMAGHEMLRGVTAGNETHLYTGGLATGMYTLVCSKDGQNRSLTIYRK